MWYTVKVISSCGSCFIYMIKSGGFLKNEKTKMEELFKNEYSKYHLEKPTILRTIDYLNNKTNRNISYNNYNLNDLLKSLKDGDFNE